IRKILEDAEKEIEDAKGRLDENEDKLKDADDRLKDADERLGNLREDLTDIDERKVETIDYENRIEGILEDMAEKVDGEWVDGRLQVAIDELEFDNPNIVSHLKDNWEQGYWATNGTTVGNSTTVRLDELLFLESGQYTITTYGNYEIRAQIFNTAGDYKRSVDVGKNTYTTILFDEDVNAGIYIRLYGESSENENINPSMVGNELLIKVEKGEKSSDWAPK